MLVLAHGNFDPLHLGHIRHLESARRLGDQLVVSVATDELCRLKGGQRPYFPAAERREAVQALRCVGWAIISDPLAAIRLLHPDIYVKGPECKIHPTPRHLDEIRLVESYGGRVCYTDDPLYSSTALMDRLLKDIGI